MNQTSDLPAVGQVVRFKRGMYGEWDGTVVSACATSVLIKFTRKNGTVTQRRGPLADVQWQREEKP